MRGGATQAAAEEEGEAERLERLYAEREAGPKVKFNEAIEERQMGLIGIESDRADRALNELQIFNQIQKGRKANMKKYRESKTPTQRTNSVQPVAASPNTPPPARTQNQDKVVEMKEKDLADYKTKFTDLRVKLEQYQRDIRSYPDLATLGDKILSTGRELQFLYNKNRRNLSNVIITEKTDQADYMKKREQRKDDEANKIEKLENLEDKFKTAKLAQSPPAAESSTEVVDNNSGDEEGDDVEDEFEKYIYSKIEELGSSGNSNDRDKAELMKQILTDHEGNEGTIMEKLDGLGFSEESMRMEKEGSVAVPTAAVVDGPSPAPSPEKANGNFQTSKTKFLQKIKAEKEKWTSKKNANLEKVKNYGEKNTPEANKLVDKIVDINKWYDEKINLIYEIIKDTTDLQEGDTADVIAQQKNYERYEFTEPQDLIQALRELENNYGEKFPPGVISSTDGDSGTTSADVQPAPSASSTALGVTEAQGDAAAAERKKEENKIEAVMKTNLLEALKYIKDKKDIFHTLADKKQHIFSFMGNKNMYLPENFSENAHKKINTRFYLNKKMDVPESVIIYNELQEQTTENDFDNIADGYSLSAAKSSELETGSQVNDNLNPTSNNQSSSGPPLHSQDLGRLKGAQAAEIKLLEKKLANMNTQKESEKQAAQDKQTEIKEALEKMLKSLKKRLEQEKVNVSEEVNKTINDKILQVERFIKKPDLDINVLTNVEKINEEIETAKWKHEFSANGVKELCESLQELMRQLTRHSRPPLTGGRKTRNKKKKKKSKAKKNKTRRRRRRSKA
jgi:hypothetical protein